MSKNLPISGYVFALKVTVGCVKIPHDMSGDAHFLQMDERIASFFPTLPRKKSKSKSKTSHVFNQAEAAVLDSFFRVEFYVENVSVLATPVARQLYYLQVWSKIPWILIRDS